MRMLLPEAKGSPSGKVTVMDQKEETLCLSIKCINFLASSHILGVIWPGKESEREREDIPTLTSNLLVF